MCICVCVCTCMYSVSSIPQSQPFVYVHVYVSVCVQVSSVPVWPVALVGVGVPHQECRHSFYRNHNYRALTWSSIEHL